MGRSAAEAQQFHNSRLQHSIQSARLPESRFGGGPKNNQAPNETEPTEAANQATQTPQRMGRQGQQSSKSLNKQIAQKQKQIEALKKELTHQRQMLVSQFMPASITVFATIPEVLTGGTLGLIATAIAAVFRLLWFSKQTIKDKLALRKQMIISSIIGMIPVIGVFLQGDLASTLIFTPRYSKRQIKNIKQSLVLRQKELNQLQSNKRSLLLNS